MDNEDFRMARLARRKTQGEWAKMIGISLSSVAKIERS